MFKIEKKGAFAGNTVKSISLIMTDIDFQPAYQRYGDVWSIEKKQLLIDSIINGYDLPKFYFHYITIFKDGINSSGKPYAIIDGKQRLQAIKDFIDNKFKLNRNFIYEKNSELKLANLTYSDLSKFFIDIKFDIDEFELDIVYIITDEIEKIEELFYRLNEGKPLNSAEKRNRIVGYLNQNIKNIIAKNLFFNNKFIYTNSRLQHEDLCLKLIIIEYNDDLITFSKQRLDNFVLENRHEKEETKLSIERFQSNLNVLNEIFVDNDKLLKSRSIIPVYYFFITRNVPKESLKNIRNFLIYFNELLFQNRNSLEPSAVLNEFDLNNQQATHTEKSLKYRLYVLSQFYQKYLENL